MNKFLHKSKVGVTLATILMSVASISPAFAANTIIPNPGNNSLDVNSNGNTGYGDNLNLIYSDNNIFGVTADKPSNYNDLTHSSGNTIRSIGVDTGTVLNKNVLNYSNLNTIDGRSNNLTNSDSSTIIGNANQLNYSNSSTITGNSNQITGSSTFNSASNTITGDSNQLNISASNTITGNSNVLTNTNSSTVTGNGVHIADGNFVAVVGNDANVTGNNTTAVGDKSSVTADNSAAFGASSTASALNSTAIGANSQATGISSAAVGNSSTASGLNSTAIGANSQATGTSSASFGNSSTASGLNSTAIGANSQATGANSAAVGINSQANGTNSVALGAGTIADRNDSVSVGNRQITNVADGTAPNDAVNMGQWTAGNAITEGKIYRSGALAAALTGIMPLAYDPNSRTQVGVGVGGYHGENAVAIGINHYINESVLVNAGMSAEGSDRMYRGGLTWRLGHTTPRVEPVADTVEIDNLKSQLQQQQSEMQILKQQVAALTSVAGQTTVVAQSPEQKIVIQDVLFDFDKDTLQQQSYPILDNLVTTIKKNPSGTYLLVGNTDSKGSKEYNMDLSLRRVKTVQNYLISQGIPANLLSIATDGELQPKGTNTTAEGRAENRRVEIHVN